MSAVEEAKSICDLEDSDLAAPSDVCIEEAKSGNKFRIDPLTEQILRRLVC